MNTNGFKKNIFEIGRTVSGESFIGRKSLLDEYSNMIYGTGKKPCLSIVGVPRCGKTSFAKRLLEIEKENTIKIYVDLATLKTFKDLWVVISQQGLRLFKEKKENPKELEEICKEILSTDNYIILKINVENFFSCLANNDIRVILVIDEFDAAKDIFSGESSSFEFCREIFSNGKFLLTAIVISRKMLSTIVAETYQTSTFSGIFYTKYFKGFDNIDLKEYWNVFTKEEIFLDNVVKKQILYYAGNSPYLLSILGYNIINNVNMGREINVDDIFLNDCKQINEYYQHIINHLTADGTKNKLVSIALGPNYKITHQDLSDFKNLGYFYVSENKIKNDVYIAFSEYFTEFLSIHQNSDIPIWPELINTEKIIKQLIRAEINEIYNKEKISDQETLIQRILVSNIKDTLNQYKGFIKDSKKKLGINNVDYLDVISLKLSFEILKKYWITIFSKYFDHDDFNRWEIKFNACAKARNPLAHGHEDYLSIQECNQVTSYCIEIQEKIKLNFMADKNKQN